MSELDVLTWKEVSSSGLRELKGYDGAWAVARVSQDPHGTGEWRWSVPAVVPARPWLTHGFVSELKEAQLSAEAAWSYAKKNGVVKGDQIIVENWTGS